MKKSLFLILALGIACHASSQHCECADDFAWLKETIEKNDAGFRYALESKGEEEYQKHSAAFAGKVKTIRDKAECAETLREWLRFFRSGHLWIGLNQAPEPESSQDAPADPEAIRQRFADWEAYPFDEDAFRAYILGLEKPGFEGIWSSPPYTIGIKKAGNEYIGFIIEADGVYWRRGQVKLRIKVEQGKPAATFYMRDHSAQNFPEAELLGGQFLQMGVVRLKRLEPALPADPALERYFRYSETRAPIFEQLNGHTAILRIPSFSHSEKPLIDSIIHANAHRIASTENLILDLRDNGGGSDASFQEILPYIYTNPIRALGVEYFSTPLNNQRMVDFMSDPLFSEEGKKWAQESLEKLNQHLGEFINLDTAAVSMTTFDTIYPYPKNVGILINRGNGSTTEQFLLAARQSKKVKLFGTTTVGVLDISNMYFIDSPCRDLKLGYSLTKSLRLPEMAIDDQGILPDYYLDKSIPPYGWIDYVEGVMSSWR